MKKCQVGVQILHLYDEKSARNVEELKNVGKWLGAWRCGGGGAMRLRRQASK